MLLASVTMINENTLTIPCLTRNPGDRVAGFRLSPEWYFLGNQKTGRCNVNRLSVRILAALALIILVSLPIVSAGCSSPKGEGMAVYLTKADIPPAQMPALSHVDIAEQPIIGLKDIITYNSQTHEIKLTSSSYEALSKLDVPVRGRSFVVCVDKQPLYWGAFWTPVSSVSFDGVTIWKPYSLREPYIVSLELGYPSASFYGGEDPRNNPDVIKSLEQAGKLITGLSITSVNELPRSMKGYELYSWSEYGRWHFTLITGTNRNKTTEEIISGEDMISEAGWVHIRVEGVQALKIVLGKIPPNEHVFWGGGLRSESTPPGSVQFSLPDTAAVSEIKDFAVQHSLDLTVIMP
jgi:hypothetical protein